MTTQRIGEPVPCAGTANGLHQAGDRCGGCYHAHCRLCGRCVSCERRDDVRCRFQPYHGEQGRREGTGWKRSPGQTNRPSRAGTT
jgi:hypothetical protein